MTDLEEERFVFEHPDGDGWPRTARIMRRLAGGAAVVALAMVAWSAPAWMAPLPPEASPIACRHDLEACRHVLPAALRALPESSDVGADARAYFLSVIASHAEVWDARFGEAWAAANPGSRSTLRNIARSASPLQRFAWDRALQDVEPELGPRKPPQWDAALENGTILRGVEAPDVEDAVWGGWAEARAGEWAATEAHAYETWRLDRARVFIEAADEARRAAEGRRTFAPMGMVLLLLAAVLALVALLASARERATAPFEVVLGRHRLRVPGRVVLLGELDDVGRNELMKELRAHGYDCAERPRLVDGVRRRQAALQQGVEPDEATRAALASLRQQD